MKEGRNNKHNRPKKAAATITTSHQSRLRPVELSSLESVDALIAAIRRTTQALAASGRDRAWNARLALELRRVIADRKEPGGLPAANLFALGCVLEVTAGWF